tara:strand:+ start:32986 stop:33519 length:534 start_codon:yes stop_codon:yes gene_type:complete
MSTLTTPPKVLICLGLLYRRDLYDQDQILESLQLPFKVFSQFNDVPTSIATMKTYYSKEMGAIDYLQRDFVVFENLVDREQLVDLKLQSDLFEKKFSIDGKRMINLDFGVISLENMVLSTGKSFSHRIYIKDGVYGELTYQTINNSYQTLTWTYPDYMHRDVIQFFDLARNYLKALL